MCWEIVLRGPERAREVHFSSLRVVGPELGSFSELGRAGKDGAGESHSGSGGGSQWEADH